MKKYIIPASLFVFNNEVLSWITLAVLVFAAVVWFAKEVDREASR